MKASENSLLDMESNDEGPRKYGKNGTFLGIRRESGYLRRSMEQGSSVAPLMPDGGLSPCVIKVLGVGGGGSNAVSEKNLLLRHDAMAQHILCYLPSAHLKASTYFFYVSIHFLT